MHLCVSQTGVQSTYGFPDIYIHTLSPWPATLNCTSDVYIRQIICVHIKTIA